ncbi:MAG TPA: universal stress protein [Solirubrobacteraceae bacterium]|nr:universal stress protein [Solirubrobacteraceae bacterium]
MFTNVLAGVDGHFGGHDAAALSTRLAAQGGQLTLAHVYPGDGRLRRQTSALKYTTRQEQRARELLGEARDQAGVSAELRCVESVSAGRGLHELAERLGVDLLVVGSSRRGMFGRVLLGDDTRESLNGAPCAVAIAPAGYARSPAVIHEVGVAYNGSVESEHAVAVARVLAVQYGARLSACEAVSLPVYAFVGGPVPIDGAIDGLVAQAQQQIEALGGIEPHATYGNVVEELSAYSASVDLLIAGSRSYGPLGRVVHGSTTRQLARAARCPLLVLPRGARVEAVEPVPQLASSGAEHVRSTLTR